MAEMKVETTAGTTVVERAEKRVDGSVERMAALVMMWAAKTAA